MSLSSLFFQVLLKPVLLDRGGFSSGGLALNLNLLGLVSLQFASKVGLLRGRGRLGDAEFLDVCLGVAGLDGRRLECTELLEVQVLNKVCCRT